MRATCESSRLSHPENASPSVRVNGLPRASGASAIFPPIESEIDQNFVEFRVHFYAVLFSGGQRSHGLRQRLNLCLSFGSYKARRQESIVATCNFIATNNLRKPLDIPPVLHCVRNLEDFLVRDEILRSSFLELAAGIYEDDLVFPFLWFRFIEDEDNTRGRCVVEQVFGQQDDSFYQILIDERFSNLPFLVRTFAAAPSRDGTRVDYDSSLAMVAQ